MAQPATLGRPTSALRPAVRVALWPALIVTALAAGLVLRIWILASPLGTLESDEAIPGLMARHALDGEFSVFYWLNLYGGTQEALATAAVFAVTGSSVLALKATAIALYTVAGVLLWLVGRRTVGERAAWLGVVLFWLSPAYFVWWTTKSRGFYALGLVCALAVLLLVLRLRERESRLDAAALGFVLGFGVWNSLQFLLGGLPALAWLAWRRPGAYRLWWLALPAFVIGAAPWLAWNAVNDWKAVVPRAVAGADTSYFERFVDLFHYVLPTWLGVRVPYSLDWLPGPVLGVAVVALVLAGFALLLLRRPPGLELLLVVGGVFPFLYAASSFAYFVAEPRYLVYLAPVTALLGGWAAARWRSALAVVPLALALSVAGLMRMERQALFQPIAQDVRVPAEMAPLLDLLEREDVDRVLANYWIAYRLSFESAETVIATSTGFVRYEPHDRLVRSSPHPARVFVEGSAVERRARADLEARGFERRTAGGWVLYAHR